MRALPRGSLQVYFGRTLPIHSSLLKCSIALNLIYSLEINAARDDQASEVIIQYRFSEINFFHLIHRRSVRLVCDYENHYAHNLISRFL